MHLKPNHPAAASCGRTLIGFNIVGGREVEGDLGLIEARSPVDSRDAVGLFPDSGAKDVERAARAAAEAQPDWSRTRPETRGRILEALAEVLAVQAGRLARVLVRETGLPPREALAEVDRARTGCLALAEVAAADPEDRVDLGGARIQRRPFGVVGLLSSRTAPFAAPCRRILSALLAGNTVVWKPSDGTPASAYLLVRALQDAGLPPGAVNTVNGRGRGGCGRHFLAGIEKGHFQLFSFAGSTALGRTVAEACGRHLVAVDLELGGRNPMLVLADADLDRAVAAAVLDAFAGAGQRAGSLGNILVAEPVAADFTARFLAAASALVVGNPVQHPEVAYGPMLNGKLAEAFRGHLERGRAQGAELLLGDGADGPDRLVGETAKGAYLPPCVWGGVTRDMALFQEELPGPAVNLCVVRDLEDAVAAAHAAPLGQGASLFTCDPAAAGVVRAALRTPSLSVNDRQPGGGAWTPEAWSRPLALVGKSGSVLPEPEAVELPPAPAPSDWALLD